MLEMESLILCLYLKDIVFHMRLRGIILLVGI